MSWNKGVEISAAAMFSTSSSSGNDTHFWAIELVLLACQQRKPPLRHPFDYGKLTSKAYFWNKVVAAARQVTLRAFARSKSFKPREKYEAHLHYARSGIVWSKETCIRRAYKYTHECLMHTCTGRIPGMRHTEFFNFAYFKPLFTWWSFDL